MKVNCLKLFLYVMCIAAATCECPKTVKYSVSTFTEPAKTFVAASISPDENAYIIKLQENVPVICKGMLNITKEAAHFYAFERNIQEIEVGAFENQNLKSQLMLSNNALSIIKRGTFKGMFITELDLSYNKITTIEEGAIENLPNLSILHLSRNKIKEFHPNSIENTPKLLFFDMYKNKMEILEDRHFFFMSKERNVGIGIALNELREIHPRAFEGIDVFTLNVTSNKLPSIPREIFSNEFQYLGIANNMLTHLDDEFFKMDTKKLRNVELEGNNFDEETTKKLKPFMEIIKQNVEEDRKRFQDRVRGHSRMYKK